MNVFEVLGKLITNREKITRLVQLLEQAYAKVQPDIEQLGQEWPEAFELSRDLIATFAPQAQRWLAAKAPLAIFDIRWLQASLTELGWKLQPDAIYGPATTRAVGEFQKQHGLTIDCWAGSDTIAAVIVALNDQRKPKP